VLDPGEYLWCISVLEVYFVNKNGIRGYLRGGRDASCSSAKAFASQISDEMLKRFWLSFNP
jgi:hypothetical protein